VVIALVIAVVTSWFETRGVAALLTMRVKTSSWGASLRDASRRDEATGFC
jgi:hypothetical protein